MKKSKFTFRHLTQLSQYSTTCPLRCIAHLDLNCYYAQVEAVRLGIPEDKPLAVQQWQGLIAINYPARAFGLGRHITATEAKKICPEIVLQHVATWKYGETKWAYHDDPDLADHKVSLDPYRMESKKIFNLIKENLPAAPLQRVEKASIDEVFCDLSAQIHAILLARYPELRGPPPYDDPTENLPCPPMTALDWHTDALIDLDEKETEEDDPDWDDVVIWLGSEIMRDMRAKIYEELKYRVSAGVARNKMLAKLGSDYKKPNAQTVIRNRAVTQFLSSFKFTKIRNLGGKLGDEIVAMFNTDLVKDLLEVPLDKLQKLGDDTGVWLYNTIRGEDNNEVNSRTQIKSMLSAKSFRPSINTFDQATKWLRIFCSDIFSRCVEEGVLENKRRPKTINFHHRQGAQTRSRQAPIPQGKPLSEELMYDLAKNLLAQVVADGRAWPCANLSLSVGGFEDGVTNTRGIGSFLVRGDEAKAMLNQTRERSDSPFQRHDNDARPVKRQKTGVPDIGRFFVNREDSKDSTMSDALPEADEVEQAGFLIEPQERMFASDDLYSDDLIPPSNQAQSTSPPAPGPATHKLQATSQTQARTQPKIETYFCDRCSKDIPVDTQSEHTDWHFAKDLAKEMQESERTDRNPSSSSAAIAHGPSTQHSSNSRPPGGRGRGRPPGRPPAHAIKGTEKGQKTLAFGKG